MACQSAPAELVLSHRPRAPDLRLRCPDLGIASLWAEARRTKIAEIVRYMEMPSVGFGRLHATWRKFMCARKAVGEAEVRGHLMPALPKQ